MSAPTTSRPRRLAAAAARGSLAGLAGVAAMTTAEAVEQRLTGRPDSYVPGRTMAVLMRRPRGEHEHPVVANHAMHWGTGALIGALRGVWAAVGIRGPRASLTHAVVRLAFDQTVENTTGRGAPPSTWPVSEQAVDILHKGVYALATGAVADAWIRPTLVSISGRTSH
jgi:hypothetical protein